MNAPKPAVDAASISDDWILKVREIVQTNGAPIRGLPDTPVIEVKSVNTNRWQPLMLPDGGTTFTSCQERDVVLNKIHRGV